MNHPVGLAVRPANPEAGLHHSSHRHLLESAEPDWQSQHGVQAIVVPTGRTPAYLRSAVDLAAQLDATLVALCSKRASVPDTVALARRAGVELVAVDMPAVPVGTLPEFRTTALLAEKKFLRPTDTSSKRNLGLLLAKLADWQRIVFLDDDIFVPRPEDLNDAVSVLDRFAAVGLHVGGFPDNSVVCHAHRKSGGVQDTFVGGGALAVGPELFTSFFPDIYNEDWFFLLNGDSLRRTGVVGEVKQNPYDPFRDQRARSEELGDTLAEGIFWLLDSGRHVQDATVAHWADFLTKRRDLITDIIRRTEAMDAETDLKQRMVSSLKAARGRSQLITPQLCVDYLRAWYADSDRWRAHVAAQEEKLSGVDRDVTMALKALDLTGCATHLPKR